MNSVVQPEGNYYDKYHSKNIIVRWMMKQFFGRLQKLLDQLEEKPSRILEAGCGEGEVTAFVRKKYPDAQIDAFDISETVIRNIEQKDASTHYYVGDIYTMQVKDIDSEDEIALKGGYDLVICSEVLEHLENPQKALIKIDQMGNGYFLLTVPREPIWRIFNICRGSYLRDLGNTPGHIQHWSKRRFVKMLHENGYEILAIKNPIPWTAVLAKKR